MKKVRQFIEYLFFLLFYCLLSLLPVSVGSKISGFICMLVGMTLKRKKRVQGQLSKYLNFNKMESRHQARLIYYHFGQNMAELFMMKSMLKRMSKINYPGVPSQNQKGNLYVTGHFSNWEVAGMPIFLSGQKTAVVYRHISNPFIDRFILKRRSLIYTGGCYEKFSVTAMDLVKLINNNVNVALLCDLRWYGGININFLGHKSYSITLPAIIALRTGTDIYSIKVNRKDNSNYTFDIDKVDIRKNKDKDNTILNITTKINNIYSSWITSSPSEWWLWTHEKWKQKDEE